MAYGPFNFGALSAAFDPNDPRYQGMQLPIPALSPQFQGGQVVPGERQMLAVGPEEIRNRPILANAIPGQPNLPNPATAYSGGMGAGFEAVPTPAIQQFPQMPQPAPQAAPQAPQVAPAPYTPGAAPQPSYAPEMAPQAYAGQAAPKRNDSILGDFGSRLQQAGAFMMGQPAAASAFRGNDNTRENNLMENSRSEREFELKRAAQAQAQLKSAQEAQRQNAPDVKVGTSENGKFRTITRTNPLTGEVSIERQAIPEDEQAPREYPKPTATADKTINEDEQSLVKSMTLFKEAEELRNSFRNGEVDVSLIGKTTAELQTLANSGDPRAANAMRVQAFIQGAANAQLRNEKGVQTDSDAKRIQAEIMGGNARLNNKQVYEWMGRYMDQLEGDTKYRTGRSTNILKRYGPDFDPDGYRQGAFQGYAETARSARDRDNESERARPYTGQAPQGARVTSPLDERLRARFGAPR